MLYHVKENFWPNDAMTNEHAHWLYIVYIVYIVVGNTSSL